MSENVSETPVRAKCGIGQDFDAKPTKSVGDYKTCLRCVRPQQRSPRCSNTPRRILEIGEVSEAHEKDRSIYVFATVSKRSRGLVSIRSGSASHRGSRSDHFNPYPHILPTPRLRVETIQTIRVLENKYSPCMSPQVLHVSSAILLNLPVRPMQQATVTTFQESSRPYVAR